jgi:NADPH-dependent 2,4-dienoyl-CoA reductase/sulfur reductase-like enzyme
LNPELGNEYKELVRPAFHPQRIVVVGAGAAGLEYALTATRRGHRVTVLEQADRIGGQIHIAAKPAHKKEELHRLLGYFEAMIKKWGIDIRLEVAATPENIWEFDPDRVILAVGSKPKKIPVPGGERAKSAVDVLQSEAGGLGKRVCIVGGDGVGIDTALYLKEMGRDATLLEMRPDIGMSLNFPIAWQFKEMLAKSGVKVLTRHEVVAIDGEGVTAKTDGAIVKIGCDNVVAAIGFDPVPTRDLEQALRNKGFVVKAIGTCLEPGGMHEAIHGGFFAALKD